eukprot:GEMP01039148.1.p1 GENE.GEMP01039148.1~~GEMP01039148.1.p1  ORF type:complete len:403 (+),score=101.37 GEMP01039148.1:47-1255(+)
MAAEPEQVSVREVPEQVGVPEVPEQVSVTEVPEQVSVAEVPEQVSVAEVPEQVSVAEVPEQVSVAEVPEQEVPEQIGVPEVAEKKRVAVVPKLAATKEMPSAIPVREDNLSYSLRDMTAFDITPIMQASAIEATARDNVQFLVNKIFALPTETTDWGKCAQLPDKATFALPREKRLPAVKAKTRWEKFAQERGIEKKKRGRMVWDETTKDWAPRYGYKSVKKNEERANWAVEIKDGEDPYAHPFQKQKAEKALVTAKQKMREMRNKVEAVGEKLPAGVTNFDEPTTKRHRGKENLQEALRRAQQSSASFGNFDKKAEHELSAKQPRRTKVKVTAPKEENAKNLKLLSRLENGMLDKAKAARVGQVSQESSNKLSKKVKKTSKRGPGGGGKRSAKGGKKRGGR